MFVTVSFLLVWKRLFYQSRKQTTCQRLFKTVVQPSGLHMYSCTECSWSHLFVSIQANNSFIPWCHAFGCCSPDIANLGCMLHENDAYIGYFHMSCNTDLPATARLVQANHVIFCGDLNLATAVTALFIWHKISSPWQDVRSSLTASLQDAATYASHVLEYCTWSAHSHTFSSTTCYKCS